MGPLPQESKDFGRIINDRQFAKLKEIIEIEYENLIYGGQFDECGLYVEPTLLDIKIVGITGSVGKDQHKGDGGSRLIGKI